MKTQGITLMTSKATEVKVTKKTTASDSTFENFIANNASAVGRQTNGANANIAETKSSMEAKSSKVQTSKKSEDGSSSNISQSKDAEQKVNNTQNDLRIQTDKPDTVKPNEAIVDENGEIDIEKVEEMVSAILTDILNLTPQDIEDIFKQIDMQPSDLITGLASGEIESFSITTVQVFVMEVHGIQDPSAFLTNDTLNREMNQIFDRMKELLAQMMQITPEKLETINFEEVEEFMQKLIPTVQTDKAVPDEVAVQNTEVTDGEVQTDAPKDLNIIVENQTTSQNDAGTDSGASDNGANLNDVKETKTTTDHTAHHAHATNTQTFVESLTQALEPETSQVQDVQRQMTEMVEQVVRQVRVRMMPESTNMEIQLHPASLGRVNVQINATGQDTTARLIVETQAAKEALEAGMIRLQEVFEERGLKVQAVEVTVGNFDLGLNNQANGDAEAENGDGKQSSGDGTQTGSGEAATSTDTNETSASRRDVNSTVDYTA